MSTAFTLIVTEATTIKDSYVQNRALDLTNVDGEAGDYSLDLVGELLGDVCAATHDADEGDVASPLVVLDDLVGDAGEGSRHRRSVHDGRLGCDLFHVAPFTKKDACA